MNLKNLLIGLITFLTTGILLSSCSSNESKPGNKIDLKLNLQEHIPYFYSTIVDQDISTSGISMHQNIVMDMKYEMLPSADSFKKLSVTYTRIAMKMNSPNGVIAFDSQDSVQNESSKGMSYLINKPFFIYFDQSGQYQKIEGISELLDSLGLEKQFADTSMFSMMRHSFDFYPAHSVSIGESWQKHTNMTMRDFKMDVDNKYTLQSVENNIATILVSAKINMPESTMEQNGMSIKLRMTGTMSGAMEISVPTGQVISGKTQQSIEGNMEAAGQKIPMSITSNISISSKK